MMCHLHGVYFSLCFSYKVRPAAFLPCTSPLCIHYLSVLTLIVLQVPRCRQNVNMPMRFNWRLHLVLFTLSFRTKGDLWWGLRVGCSQCWQLHRFFSAQLSSSLAPRGGSNWFQELLGIFPSFADIFPSPIKHTHNLLPTKLPHIPWDC